MLYPELLGSHVLILILILILTILDASLIQGIEMLPRKICFEAVIVHAICPAYSNVISSMMSTVNSFRVTHFQKDGHKFVT